MTPDAALSGILSAVITLCQERTNEGFATAGLLADIAGQARTAPANPAPPAPRQLPACRHLARALSLAERGPAAELAEAFAAMAKGLRWTQNANYLRDPIMRAFLADYAYVELVGPGGIAREADTALGMLLISPQSKYPPHRHPAQEVYLVLAGEANWWREGEPWRIFPAATLVHHEPNVAHAMRTLNQPLLALYAWRGEIGTAARLVGN